MGHQKNNFRHKKQQRNNTQPHKIEQPKCASISVPPASELLFDFGKILLTTDRQNVYHPAVLERIRKNVTRIGAKNRKKFEANNKIGISILVEVEIVDGHAHIVEFVRLEVHPVPKET